MLRIISRIVVIIAVTAVICTGCASLTEPHMAALAAAVPQYSDYSEFRYLELPPNEKTEYRIEPGSPAHVFKAGKSYFLALEIPESTPKYVNVTSRLIGEWIPTSHMLFPAALFLDQDYQVISRIQPKLIYNPRFGHGLDFDSQTEIPDGARYLVLHSVPDIYGIKVPLGAGYTGDRAVAIPLAGSGSMFVAAPGFENSTAIGPTGQLWVEYTDATLDLPNHDKK